MANARPHCVLVGIGPGTGAACARRFSAEGYTVSIISRSEERLDKFTTDIPNTVGYTADIAQTESFRERLQEILSEDGCPQVVLFNATQATFGTYTEIPVEKLIRNFRVNTAGLLVTAQVFGPVMEAAGKGSIVVTGNTAATRGKPDFAGWASTKAGQRNLAESLARELGPKGVHVAYVIIDAVIDMPFARRRWPNKTNDFYAQPDDLAAEIYHVAHQPRSAQSFLTELRPFGEQW